MEIITSLKVAEKFGKRHDNLLNTVHKLVATRPEMKPHFKLVCGSAKDARGKLIKRIYYEIDHVGFKCLTDRFINVPKSEEVAEASDATGAPGATTSTSMELVVITVDNRAITTSLMIAEKFGKQHFHVMRDIRNLIAKDQTLVSNFGCVEIIEKNAIGGEVDRSYYTMDRDGFVLLAFGFTGARALQFKKQYIAAFNKMEAELRNRQSKSEADHGWNLQALAQGILELTNWKKEAEVRLAEQESKLREYENKATVRTKTDPNRSLMAGFIQAGIPYPRKAISWMRVNGWIDYNNLPVKEHPELMQLRVGATAGNVPYRQTVLTPAGVTYFQKLYASGGMDVQAAWTWEQSHRRSHRRDVTITPERSTWFPRIWSRLAAR